MSWFGAWFGNVSPGGAGLVINDGVYLELDDMQVNVSVDFEPIEVVLQDDAVSATVETDDLEIEVAA